MLSLCTLSSAFPLSHLRLDQNPRPEEERSRDCSQPLANFPLFPLFLPSRLVGKSPEPWPWPMRAAGVVFQVRGKERFLWVVLERLWWRRESLERFLMLVRMLMQA